MHRFRDGGEDKLENYFIMNRSNYNYFFYGCEWGEGDTFTFDCHNKPINDLFHSYSSSNQISKITLLNSTSYFGSSLFYNCQHLVEINATLRLSQFNQTFNGCRKLKILPTMDFSIASSLLGIFDSCELLETIPDIYAPQCSGQTNRMFMNCKSLKSLGKITIANNTALEGNAFGYTFNTSYYLPNLTDFGGVVTNKSFNLTNLSGLTESSVNNVLESVIDLTGNPTQTITFNSAVYNTLTEEQKSLAASKNWTLASA